MEVITYSLDNKSPEVFYNKLSLFTDKILAEAKMFFYKDISSFKDFLKKNKLEIISNDDEYIIDIVSLGIYFEKYIGFALGSGRFSNYMLYSLYRLRSNFTSTKKTVDYLRGHLADFLLYSKYYSNYEYSAAAVVKLLSWMKATGEFPEEVKHLKLWGKYFDSLPSAEAAGEISRIVAFSKYFEDEGNKYFEDNTKRVSKFLKYIHPNYRKREDYLFCGRSEAEYFLNFFGAEVINRNEKKEFDKTKKKIVLLPACMRKPSNGICKAINKGNALECTSCSVNCEINRVQSTLLKSENKVIIFKHSTDLSNYLRNWKKNNNGGLVGVACSLNLIKGGYELQKLNIPSQCVFLNYCGCKEHWHNTGIPTSLDHRQLRKILSVEDSVVEKEKILIENQA